MMSSLGDKGFFTRRQNRDYSDNSGEILGAVQEVCDSYLLAWGESSADVQAQVLDVTMQVADNITTRALGAPANV
jgi:hypothetical protein